MIEHTPITIVSEVESDIRYDLGVYVPMNEGAGLQIVDCGDKRGITQSIADFRRMQYGEDISPGRVFGGAWGAAFAMIAARATKLSQQELRSEFGYLNPEAIVDLAVDTADRAIAHNISLTLHSDTANEQHAMTITDSDNPIGCAGLRYASLISECSGNELAFSDATAITDTLGIDLPLKDAQGGITAMNGIMTGKEVHRGALRHALKRLPNRLSVAILEGRLGSNSQAKMTIDLAGVRSDGRRSLFNGLERYVHTPAIVANLVPRLDPAEHAKTDFGLLMATSLLHAMGVRQVLSGDANPRALRLEVMPMEYAR